MIPIGKLELKREMDALKDYIKNQLTIPNRTMNANINTLAKKIESLQRSIEDLKKDK